MSSGRRISSPGRTSVPSSYPEGRSNSPILRPEMRRDFIGYGSSNENTRAAELTLGGLLSYQDWLIGFIRFREDVPDRDKDRGNHRAKHKSIQAEYCDATERRD